MSSDVRINFVKRTFEDFYRVLKMKRLPLIKGEKERVIKKQCLKIYNLMGFLERPLDGTKETGIHWIRLMF